MNSSLFRLYQTLVIDRPVVALAVVVGLVGFFALYGQNFKLDASSESIVLENDQALKYYRATRETYGSDDFLIVSYTPHDDLLSPASLKPLAKLRDELAQLDSVKAVRSILDVPLVNSPKIPISELIGGEGVRTLETPDVNKELARTEFLESPVYQNNLVSPDARTTAIQVVFKEDETYAALLNERNRLREKKIGSRLTPEEEVELATATRVFSDYHAAFLEAGRKDIDAVRGILNKYRESATLYLGGVRMIIADMIRFIEHDLAVFGVGVIGFLVAALVYFFRKLRWVLLPTSCCVISVSVMVGFLGFMDWPVTVISSNFVSLLLIITMSLTIHLIVRYRILAGENPEADQNALVSQTVQEMAKPCLYTAVTTVVAFCSLIVSDIRPVIDFGWMMTMGITFAFVLNFIYFPAVLALLKPEKTVVRPDATRSFTMAIAGFTLKYVKPIIAGCLALAVLGGVGMMQLEVENRFIDHFKRTTEIYQGMELIDTKLGGTIPLDIVIDADEAASVSLEETQEMDDPFDDPFGEEEEQADVTSYWFNGDQLTKLETVPIDEA